MKRDICPNCNKRGLEKMKPNPFFDELYGIQNEEWWGCVRCGQAFFKKIEVKEEKGDE